MVLVWIIGCEIINRHGDIDYGFLFGVGHMKDYWMQSESLDL